LKRAKLKKREEGKREEEKRQAALAKAAAAPPGNPGGGLAHTILAIAVGRHPSSSNSSKMLVLKADTGEVLEEEHDDGFVTCVALSPDGKSLAWAAFSDRPGRTNTDFVTLWDVPSGEARAYLRSHDRQVSHVYSMVASPVSCSLVSFIIYALLLLVVA